MHRFIPALALGLALAGCEHFTPQEHFAPMESVRSVQPDMNQAQVLSLLGAPGQRHVQGTQEAWEYCFNGWMVDDYVLIWFDQGSVVGTEMDGDAELGHCSPFLEAFSWDNAPSS